MGKTANYGLPKWEKSDFIKMDDFNDLTAKLDAALKSARTVYSYKAVKRFLGRTGATEEKFFRLDNAGKRGIMEIEKGAVVMTVSPQSWLKQYYVDRLGASRAVNTLLGLCRS